MNTIKNAIESVKSTISDALATTSNEVHSNVQDTIALEEQERAYRLEHAAQDAIRRKNAEQASGLISSLQFPYFKGGLNKGYKAYTRRAEELERQRLLAAKADLALKRNNARTMAGHINALGWPFIRNSSGTQYILTDFSKLAEEEERDRRLADKNWMMHSRNNAALVSNLIRWDNYQRHTNAGLKRMTRNWEEKERKARLADKADQERAADLAFQTSGLIRRLGWPFYAQPSLAKDYTRTIEEEEKNLRLANPHERLMAQEKAGLVADLIHSKDASFLEEKEKERRIQDTLEQERHRAHANKVASIIAWENDPRELERKRLLADKTHSREAQLGAKRIADIVPHFMTLSSWSLKRATDQERNRRMNDVTAQAYAKFTAKKVSQLILDADLEKKTAWTNELEQERMRRMHDHSASNLSKKNARKVSNLILNRNGSSLSAVEGERARRLADLSEQQRHRNVAKRLSDMLLDPSINNRLNKSPINDVELGLPMATATRTAPIIPADISAPVAAAAPLVEPSPSPVSALETPLPSAPLVEPRSVPLSSSAASLPQTASISPAVPLSSSAASRGLPLEQVPFLGQQAPMMQGQQFYTSPSAIPSSYSPSALPVNYSSPSTLPMGYSSPSAIPVSYSSPSTLPVGYSSPSALPLSYTTGPTVVNAPMAYSSNPMPGSYTPTYLTGNSAAPYVPFDPAVPSHLRVMTDKERKKLEKQASKHSRSSQRDARRAEHHLAKAEKLHFRGKDARALKHETKAEQHNVAAKHHQAWAQELATDSLSHTLPSALPTVYRPAM